MFSGRPPKVGSPSWLARQAALSAWQLAVAAESPPPAATAPAATATPQVAPAVQADPTPATPLPDTVLPPTAAPLSPQTPSRTIVPGHITTPPLLDAIAAAQARAPQEELDSWSAPPFSALTFHGHTLITRAGSLWVPDAEDELKEELLDLAHQAVGFRGADSLHDALLGAHVNWSGLRADVSAWVASSPQRQAAAVPRPNGPASRDPGTRGAFNPTLAPAADHTVYLDYMGPLPPALTPEGATASYIIVAIDPFTRWVEARPCAAANADASLAALDAWTSSHGAPLTIRADGARHFNATKVKAWARAASAALSIGTPLHPAGQGIVERRMADLAYLLKVLSSPDEPWTSVLQRAITVLNDAVCRSTGISAFHARFGHPRRTPLAAAVGVPPVDPALTPASHIDSLAATQGLALLASATSQAISKGSHDAAAGSHPTFAPGQHVLFCADTPTKLDTVGILHIIAERVTDSEYVIYRPLTPLDRFRAATERLIPYDESRTNHIVDAEARLPAGTRIVTRIVGHRLRSGLLTFNVELADGSSDADWLAADLCRHHSWRHYVLAQGLQLDPSAAAYEQPPPAQTVEMETPAKTADQQPPLPPTAPTRDPTPRRDRSSPTTTGTPAPPPPEPPMLLAPQSPPHPPRRAPSARIALRVRFEDPVATLAT